MDDPNCNYINPAIQNARDMNLNCVSDPSSGEDKYCLSQYKLYDNIAQRSSFLGMKRNIDAGYGVVHTNYESYDKNKVNANSPYNDMQEGFTGKIFIGPDGPGKRTLKKDKCPQGYSWCDKSNKCIQVCMGCKYEDNMKSQDFNEYDPCFPNGVYDGVKNNGTIKCTCGKNNQYCSDNLIEDIFATIGLFS